MAMRARWTRGALGVLLTVGPGCGLAPEIFVGAQSEPRGAPRSGTPAPGSGTPAALHT